MIVGTIKQGQLSLLFDSWCEVKFVYFNCMTHVQHLNFTLQLCMQTLRKAVQEGLLSEVTLQSSLYDEHN